jgi:hypothetical protein
MQPLCLWLLGCDVSRSWQHTAALALGALVTASLYCGTMPRHVRGLMVRSVPFPLACSFALASVFGSLSAWERGVDGIRAATLVVVGIALCALSWHVWGAPWKRSAAER